MKTIALTIGDPNGIGPEIAVKAAAVLRTLRLVGNLPAERPKVAGAA